jgi:glycosyltransferase involved in cell wall biosynthesis
MKKIKIFALVEGKIIDELSDRVSGTFIRIHYILKYLKQHRDIKLIYIPFQYKQKYSQTYSKLNWCIDTFYHFAVPFLSLLIIIFRHPHFIYFSYPNVVYNDKYNIYLLRFAKRVGIKLLMYSHDWVDQSEVLGLGKNKLLAEKLEKELVELSDILVVVSSKYPKYETAILPGGLEEEEFENLKYEIHEGRFNIAYTGSMMCSYGIDVLVDAAIMLHKKYPCIKLYLFGEIITLDDETKKKIEGTSFITQKVIPRTELISLFSEVDVFAYTYNPAIPYFNYTRSTKFFEYIGSEIPFIATKCEGLKLITDGKGLLWVDYSVEDFCEKLEYLLKNPQERMRLSKELHDLKKDNTWKKRADVLHELIVNHLDKEKVNSK